MATSPSDLATRLAWRLQAWPRRLRAARGDTLQTRGLRLVSGVGYQIDANVTAPAGGPHPGVVISPAIHQGRAAVEGWVAPVNAAEIARLGYAVMTYDPAGRGESWGEEDFGGPEHQDDLLCAIKALQAAPECDGRVGVLSLSLGIAAAARALADRDLGVRWLVDWEGPCDREIITSGGTLLLPAAGHTMDDDGYWAPREAVRHVARLRCGYVRLQALPDHAQPGELRHAERMIRAAATGALPWFQLNDHVRGEVPQRPNWLRGGPLAANAAILRKLEALR